MITTLYLRSGKKEKVREQYERMTRENLEGKLDKKERKDYIKKGIIAK